MSYQADIMTALLADETVSGFVGTRIFADIADGTAAAPFVVYQVVSTDSETTYDGDRTIEFPLVQFSCWASSKASAIALATALNAVLDGNTIAGPAGATFVFSNQSGTYESDTKLFGEILEYRASCAINA